MPYLDNSSHSLTFDGRYIPPPARVEKSPCIDSVVLAQYFSSSERRVLRPFVFMVGNWCRYDLSFASSGSAPCPVAAISENVLVSLFYILAAAHSLNSASSCQLTREIFAKTIQGNKAMNKPRKSVNPSLLAPWKPARPPARTVDGPSPIL